MIMLSSRRSCDLETNQGVDKRLKLGLERLVKR
jgi:hypothetical protein